MFGSKNPSKGRSLAALLLLVVCALVLPSACVLSPVAGPSASSTEQGTNSPGQTTPPATAGLVSYVFGTVRAGPVCPVERVPPDPACAPRAVVGATIIASLGGIEAARATSASDGSYQMVIPAFGTITLTAKPVPGLLGTPAPVVVMLAPMESHQVDFLYDTGIR